MKSSALLIVIVTIFFSCAKKTTSTSSSATVTTQPEVVKSTVPKDGITRIKIITDSGTMIVKLYDSTPLHRDNFVKLVNQRFYDSLLFHRVIAQFMIQGGDPESKNAPAGHHLGSGGGNMPMIPAEFRHSLMHKRGALAAARSGNPAKASSACQFYIVQGKPVTDAEMDMMENRKQFKYTPAQREEYKRSGGTPFLDMDYTVFGELESGMDVIDKIASVPKDQSDRPLANVRMRMEVIK